MKHLKKLGLASALALVATCGVVGSASATAIDPANTAFTLTSTDMSIAVSGGGTVSCTHSTISGTTPAAGVATWRTIVATTETFSGCTALGFVGATVTPSGACPVYHIMGVDSSTAIVTKTLPAGCSIDIAVPAIGCTMTITGPQTIGNGGHGSGGFSLKNLAKALLAAAAVLVPHIVSNGIGFGCSTAGDHTGTLNATYTRSSATNIVATP